MYLNGSCTLVVVVVLAFGELVGIELLLDHLSGIVIIPVVEPVVAILEIRVEDGRDLVVARVDGKDVVVVIGSGQVYLDIEAVGKLETAFVAEGYPLLRVADVVGLVGVVRRSEVVLNLVRRTRCIEAGLHILAYAAIDAVPVCVGGAVGIVLVVLIGEEGGVLAGIGPSFSCELKELLAVQAFDSG